MDRRRITQTICVILAIVLALILAVIVYIDDQRTKQELQVKQQIWEAEQREKEREYSIIVQTNSLVSNHIGGGVTSEKVFSGEALGKVILLPMDFQEYSNQDGYYQDAYISKKVNVDVEKTDILVLEFQAYTLDGSAELQVRIGSVRENVYINTNKQSFYIPVSGVESIDDVTFKVVSDFRKTVVDSITLVNYQQNYDIHLLKTGVFSEETYDSILIDASERMINRSTQMLKKNDTLFVISADNGTLVAYKENLDGTVSELSILQGIGTVRDMAFTKNKDAIVITARQNGVYIVDVKDSTNMRMLSHYDTLEFATGLCVRDDFLFISSRYFGVEIVDISDLTNPRFINCISSEGCEYQDCFVDDDELYVGVYYNKRVDVFDISDAQNPTKLSSINLDGSGQGIFVENGILYAATALDSPSSEGKLWNYGKGTGNGVEIYDVTDPRKPVQLSVVKTDGRLSVNTNDVWDITISNGYAYLSNMFGGVYVYDVSTPLTPRRVAVYNISASQNSELFREQNVEGYLFPYDVAQETRGCAYHVTLDNGKFYIVTSNMGIYRVDCDYAYPETNDNYTTMIANELTVEIPQSRNYTINHYKNDGCIWAVATTEDHYFLANGDAGIVILSKNLEEIMRVRTGTSVRDVKIHNYIMYTAESEGGIGIYNIENPMDIQLIGRFEIDSKKECITQLQLTNDKKFLLALASVSSYKIIDVSNPIVPVEANVDVQKSIGLMYYRALCSGVVGEKYIGLAGSNYQCWYQSIDGELRLINQIDNILYNKSNGFTAVGDKCIAIYNNGYVFFDPAEGEFSNRVKIEGVTFEGKCSSNGEIMVISTSYSGKIQIVDVKNLNSPRLSSEMDINGNPDVATFDGSTIIIPCRYYGLLTLVPLE